jgi:hypothetical protein
MKKWNPNGAFSVASKLTLVMLLFNKICEESIVLAIRAGSASGRKDWRELLSVVAAIGILSMTASAQPSDGLFTPGASISFTGTGEINCGNLTPADQAIAVGDTNVGVLQAINVCLDVYTKMACCNPAIQRALPRLPVCLRTFPPLTRARCSTGSIGNT